MINWPVPPSGGSNEASFMRRLVDCCKRSVPRPGPGLLADETAGGIILRPALTLTNSAQAKFQLYQITGLKNDNYFKAQILDGGGNPSGSDVSVAKCYTGQTPADGDHIDTYFIEYGGVTDNTRVASADMLGEENQVCHPRYTVGDFLVVIQTATAVMVSDEDGNTVPLLDDRGQTIFLYELSPERFWAAAQDDYTPPA